MIDVKNKEIEELKLLLENKNVNINEEIQSHETDKSEHIVQIKSLQEKLDSEIKLNERNLDLMKTAEVKFIEEISGLTHENKSLSAHIESNKIRESEERKCLEDQVCELINLLKDKSNELDRVVKSRDTTLASFVENEKVVESWKSKFYQVNERYEEMKLDSSQKISYLEDKLENQRLSMFELREVTKELKMAKDDLTSRYRDLEAKLHASRESEEATKIKANKQNQILHEKLSQLEKDFSNLSIVNGKIGVNPQRLSELEKKILDSESNLKIKSTMLDDQNELIKILREKIFDLESKIKASLSQLNTLQSEIKDLKKHNKDLESKLGHKKKLEVELRSLIKELSRDLYEDLGINRLGSSSRNKVDINNIEENDYGISSDEEDEEKDEEDE
jgi:chromosome segregation ATPase